MRFGVLGFAMAPYSRLVERWRRFESLGFDDWLNRSQKPGDFCSGWVRPVSRSAAIRWHWHGPCLPTDRNQTRSNRSARSMSTWGLTPNWGQLPWLS